MCIAITIGWWSYPLMNASIVVCACCCCCWNNCYGTTWRNDGIPLPPLLLSLSSAQPPCCWKVRHLLLWWWCSALFKEQFETALVVPTLTGQFSSAQNFLNTSTQTGTCSPSLGGPLLWDPYISIVAAAPSASLSLPRRFLKVTGWYLLCVYRWKRWFRLENIMN